MRSTRCLRRYLPFGFETVNLRLRTHGEIGEGRYRPGSLLGAMIESERNIVNTATVHLDNLSEPSPRPPTVLLITPHVQVAPDSILPALQSVLSLCLLTLRVKRVIHILETS